MGFILIGVLILLYTAQSVLEAQYTKSYPGEKSLAAPVFTVISGTLTAVVSFFVAGCKISVSPLTLILAIANAFMLVIYNISLMRASENGSYSTLMVFNISGGIVLPAIAAAMFMSQPLSAVKIVCMTAVIICGYFITLKDDERTKPTKSFLLFCLLLAVSNGLYGSFLSLQAEWTGAEEKAEMVGFTFLFAALLSFITLIPEIKKEKIKIFRQNKTSLIFLLTASVVVAAAVHLLTFIIDMLDTAVLYTFDTSGVLVLSVLYSCIFFKEKLSKKNIAGIIVLLIALLAMSPLGEGFIYSLFK